MPSLFGGEEEGVLLTRQPLGLEAEPRNRGLPITGSQSPGPIPNKQTNLGLKCSIMFTMMHLEARTVPLHLKLVKNVSFFNLHDYKQHKSLFWPLQSENF